MRWIVLAVAALAAVADAAPKRKPGAFVVVIDRSGSMQGPKLDAAKAAALATLDALAPDDQIAILAFDSEEGLVELLKDMRAADITVSAVGVAGADRNLLNLIADTGDGRVYYVEDLKALPKLFAAEVAAALR